MPTSEKDWVFYTYDNERDGNLAVATPSVTTAWFNVEGASELIMTGAFAGGTTTIDVEQSKDGVNADSIKAAIASAGLTDGIKINLGYAWVRFKFNQATAVTTDAEFSVKASD